MKKSIFAASVCCIVLAMTSCKSHESAYMAAYQQAKAQEAAQQQTQTVVETPTVTQTPVVTTPTTTTTTTTPTNTNVSVRTEGLSVVEGTALRAYSVVVGSFGLKTNAQRLAQELRSAGYDSRIAYNSERDLYRVVASSFDTKSEAATSRDRLEATYPGAWLLYQK